MKYDQNRVILILLFLFIFTPFSGADAQQEQVLSEIKLLSSESDFGNVLEGKQVHAVFQLENIGNAPLNIIKVIPDCGCLVAKLERQIVLPGETLPVGVTFDTRGFIGVQRKQLVLVTDNLSQPQVELTMYGEVEPELEIVPNKIFISKTSTNQLASRSSVKFNLKVHAQSKASIAKVVDLSQLTEIANLRLSSKKASFDVNYLPPAKSGLYRDRLVVELKDAARKSYNIPVFIKIEDSIQVIPSALSFGLIERNKPIEQTLKIEFQPELDLEILEIESSDPAVSAVLLPNPLREKGIIKLLVTVDPAQFTNNLLAVLILKTNQEESPEISVNVFATKPPVLDD